MVGLHVLRHTGLLFGRSGDWTQFCYVLTLSRSLRIYFFHSGERTKSYPDSLPHSPDTCGSRTRTGLAEHHTHKPGL